MTVQMIFSIVALCLGVTLTSGFVLFMLISALIETYFKRKEKHLAKLLKAASALVDNVKDKFDELKSHSEHTS